MNDGRPSPELEPDVRVRTTRSIWSITPALLGICIPLSMVTESGPAIPIVVLCAAAVSTVTVWMRGGAGQTRPAEKQVSAQSRVQELEERLANLEAITNFEHKLLDVKYSGAAPVPTNSAPPMPVDSASPLPSSRSAASRPIAS
ncbi:MAG TPA: hypothetical protein VF627_01160 [Abditibacterium sp.]|jgi:hypothetical protein